MADFHAMVSREVKIDARVFLAYLLLAPVAWGHRAVHQMSDIEVTVDTIEVAPSDVSGALDEIFVRATELGISVTSQSMQSSLVHRKGRASHAVAVVSATGTENDDCNKARVTFTTTPNYDWNALSAEKKEGFQIPTVDEIGDDMLVYLIGKTGKVNDEVTMDCSGEGVEAPLEVAKHPVGYEGQCQFICAKTKKAKPEDPEPEREHEWTLQVNNCICAEKAKSSSAEESTPTTNTSDGSSKPNDSENASDESSSAKNSSPKKTEPSAESSTPTNTEPKPKPKPKSKPKPKAKASAQNSTPKKKPTKTTTTDEEFGFGDDEDSTPKKKPTKTTTTDEEFGFGDDEDSTPKKKTTTTTTEMEYGFGDETDQNVS